MPSVPTENLQSFYWPYRLFRDPFSGLTHLVGALLGVVGLVYMLQLPVDSQAAWGSLLIYGLSLILLYASSAAYHLLHVSPSTRVKLRQLDHSMVSIFIAGTYTPFCVIALKGWVGESVLAVIWTLAIGGLVKSLYWLNSPRWITAGVYLLMGWVLLVAIYPLAQAVTPLTFWLILGGGVLYSIGATIYAKKWPDPFPPHFGFHEIWHLFVMAGSACHFLAVLALLRGQNGLGFVG